MTSDHFYAFMKALQAACGAKRPFISKQHPETYILVTYKE